MTDTTHTTCPVCGTECTQDSSAEGTQSLRPAGLTMDALRAWATYHDVAHRKQSQVARKSADRHFYGGYVCALQDIIRIIDAGRLPE
jgi:hypothetical protein